MKQDLYTTVTEKILAELETGAAPWVKPWKSRATAGIGNRPRNAATGRAMPAPASAAVEPYQAPTEPTTVGLQYVMPGCAKDRSRQAAPQFDLF